LQVVTEQDLNDVCDIGRESMKYVNGFLTTFSVTQVIERQMIAK